MSTDQRTWMKLRWDDLCIIGYGLGARWDAVKHFYRGHDIVWREDATLWSGITGAIVCRNCPDTNEGKGGNDLYFWVRSWRWIGWIGERVCGLLGHPLFQHPMRYDKYLDEEVYCYRCGFGAPLRKTWLETPESDD